MSDITAKQEISRRYLYSSQAFGFTGLQMFYKGNVGYHSTAVIGNITISIELLIKGIIADHNLLLLFENMSLELKTILCTQEDEFLEFNKKHELELKSPECKSIDFTKAINTLFILYPELHNRFKKPLKDIVFLRNQCIHSAYPALQAYEIKKTVYYYLTLIDLLKQQPNTSLRNYHCGFSKENSKFLVSFNEEKTEHVNRKFKIAKENAKNISTQKEITEEYWDAIIIDCPICDNKAYLHGETKAEYEQNGEFDVDTNLTFIADSFECEHCGLKLDDFEELSIAEIENIHDRSDELMKWYADNMDDLYIEY